MDTNEEKYKACDQVLGTPVLIDLSENALKIRRNLIMLSGVILFIGAFGISIHTESTILGLKFINLNDRSLKIGLFLTNLYFLIHFGWYAFDGILEWLVRLTGMKHLSAPPFENEVADRHTDVRQSTLYNWWRLQSANSTKLIIPTEELNDYLTQLKRLLDNDAPLDWNAHELTSAIDGLKLQSTNLMAYLKKSQSIWDNPRVTGSLKRFDSWFMYFQKSQNLRFVLIELLLPVVLSVLALIALLLDLNDAHLYNTIRECNLIIL